VFFLNKITYLHLIAGFSYILLWPFLSPTLVKTAVALPSETNPDFVRLKQALEKYGFKIRLQLPPIDGNYGMLETSSKSIWINPAVFELGIARPTLVHEAVHAVQLCAGGTKLQLLNLEISPPIFARPYFVKYSSPRRELEAEAYAVQAQPDSIEVAIALLDKHCSNTNQN
jgi:hypothetical protein